MSHGDTTTHDLPSLVNSLSTTAALVEADDLSGLAKMHGWSEAIVVTTGAGSKSPCPSVCKQADALVRLLEALILGEARDAQATLTAVVEAVAGLNRLVAEACSPTEPAEAPAPEPSVPALAAETPAAQPVVETGASAKASAAPDAPSEEEAYESQPLRIPKKEFEFVKAFVEESFEHIASIEVALLEVERAPDNPDRINDLFRPFHTIKGMAGFLNLRDIGCLTHEAETVLDHCRKGKRSITPGLIDIVFNVVDILKAQVSAVGGYLADPRSETVPQPPVGGMIHRLRAINAGRLEPEERSTGGTRGGRLGTILIEQAGIAPEVVDYAVELQKSGATGKKIGEILIDSDITTARQVGQAIRSQTQAADAQPGGAPATGSVGDQSVRIDTVKLDCLVDMVGELVIAQTQVSAHAGVTLDSRLAKAVGQATKIVRDVQEVAMTMRMVPIGPTFQKMARLVRDVSRKAGKQVELKISGEDTELDKNVIQQIGDPLIHMVRNAVDHGIEPAETRQACGKSAAGNVHLSACHQGGNIAIEISDDGKGLDSAALVRKAIEKGLVQPGTELSEQEAFALVFAPGFSTAERVTDISGRGVGMDVVRRNVEQLRGRVEIRSEKGRGSTFTLRLPLTLAIIDGMVVGVGTERFIIQTIAIEQSLRPVPSQITTVRHKGAVVNVRGRLVPLIQLGELFGLTGRIDPCQAMVVIGHAEGRQIGLVVDRLIGQQQVVIKTLGERFEKLKGIAGGAILGDGRVGLILEMSGLLAAFHSRRRPPRRIRRDAEVVEAETTAV